MIRTFFEFHYILQILAYNNRMEIDSCREDKLEAYSLLYNRSRFGFVSKINMDNLKYFSIENQKNLGKIDIKIDINAIKRLHNNKNMNYLVMTQYQQIIPIIYFLRSQPPSCKILTTKIMLQTAIIYAQDFYHVIKKKNQVVTIPTYEQESQTYDNYEINLHINCGQWITIFNKEQILNVAERAVPLNYGQIYDTERGTLITPYPSGINVGSAVWIFENQLTKNKLLWVQGFSHHSWRACQQFEIDPVHKEINNIVFTAGVLTNPATIVQDQHQCLQFLKIIEQRLNKNINSRVVIHDFLMMADIINYIFYQFKDKLKRIFITGASVKNSMSYINSYPQFLTWNHKKRIYQDPPVYPFETFVQLKQKIIYEGTLEQISAEQKIPLKELTLKSTPYIQFEADFHSFLVEGENQVAESMFQKFYDLNKLRKFLNERRIGNIICICKDETEIKNIPDLEHSFTLNEIENHIFIPDQNLWKYYTVEGIIPHHICQFTKKNGWLKLAPIEKSFKELSKDWHIKLGQQFYKRGIQVINKSENIFETRDTKVKIDNFKISIESKNEKELLMIHSGLNQLSRVLQIKDNKIKPKQKY